MEFRQNHVLELEGLMFIADDLRNIADRMDISVTKKDKKKLIKLIERLGLK